MVPSPAPEEVLVAAREAPADTDRLLRVLSDSRRRSALRELSEAGESLALADLAARVLARESGRDESDLARSVERSILVSLYHVHAPKLAAVGLVEFDPDLETVELTDLGRELQPLAT